MKLYFYGYTTVTKFCIHVFRINQIYCFSLGTYATTRYIYNWYYLALELTDKPTIDLFCTSLKENSTQEHIGRIRVNIISNLNCTYLLKHFRQYNWRFYYVIFPYISHCLLPPLIRVAYLLKRNSARCKLRSNNVLENIFSNYFQVIFLRFLTMVVVRHISNLLVDTSYSSQMGMLSFWRYLLGERYVNTNFFIPIFVL